MHVCASQNHHHQVPANHAGTRRNFAGDLDNRQEGSNLCCLPARVRDFDPIYSPRKGAVAPRDACAQRTDVPPRVSTQLAPATRIPARSASLLFLSPLVDRARRWIRNEEATRGLLGCLLYLDPVVAHQAISPYLFSFFLLCFHSFIFPIRK